MGLEIVGLRFANPTYQIYAQSEQILPPFVLSVAAGEVEGSRPLPRP